MFYVYGAKNSKATEKAELLLETARQDYRVFILGVGYTVNQLQKLVPGTDSVPHIFDGTKYIGGTKELYDYLYSMVKFENEEEGDEK
jgi:hypothetical protein